MINAGCAEHMSDTKELSPCHSTCVNLKINVKKTGVSTDVSKKEKTRKYRSKYSVQTKQWLLKPE